MTQVFFKDGFHGMTEIGGQTLQIAGDRILQRHRRLSVQHVSGCFGRDAAACRAGDRRCKRRKTGNRPADSSEFVHSRAGQKYGRADATADGFGQSGFALFHGSNLCPGCRAD